MLTEKTFEGLTIGEVFRWTPESDVEYIKTDPVSYDVHLAPSILAHIAHGGFVENLDATVFVSNTPSI